MRVLVAAGAAGFLVIAAMTAAEELLSDPTQAFVEGYDPSGNDFLANTPERTVLLRIRADFDNDGIEDLALSDSSTWGNAAGQWLFFRGQRDHRYIYWGTLFFSPSVARLTPLAGGTSELALYVRTSASQGALQVYRLTGGGITRISDAPLDLERQSDRERYDALVGSAPKLPVEYCKLLDYRRDAVHCWQPGLGLR